jgi:hypothetical protein
MFCRFFYRRYSFRRYISVHLLSLLKLVIRYCLGTLVLKPQTTFFILLMFVSLWCLYLYDVCTSMMFVGISMMFDVCCLFILSPSAKLNKTHQSHLVFYTNWKKVKKTKLKWLYYPRSISFEMGLHPSEIIANYFSLTLSAFVQLSFRTNSTKHLKNIFLSYLR